MAPVEDNTAAQPIQPITTSGSCHRSRVVSPSLAVQARAHGNDFRLIYVCQFLAGFWDEISERVVQGSYEQLLWCIRGFLDQ